METLYIGSCAQVELSFKDEAGVVLNVSGGSPDILNIKAFLVVKNQVMIKFAKVVEAGFIAMHIPVEDITIAILLFTSAQTDLFKEGEMSLELHTTYVHPLFPSGKVIITKQDLFNIIQPKS